ncbi:MAG: hypothetical protein EWV85_16280 [Microcystis aeruginosa Ma_QC_C_20070703_M131]|uniref:Uncharacterized protein n=1 Tax=Microcystis aeruginosa Ma_QC_C_20070703_M131 TaxID=2486263 RepID=A0A551XPJ8_MICAE|nr:MAG: hypothetical protein EWV85_16280 [Microcystis aeruginosa Ma_QC_C_20070703_M131]
MITSSLLYQYSGVRSQKSGVSFYLFSPSPQPPTDYCLLITEKLPLYFFNRMGKDCASFSRVQPLVILIFQQF